MNIENILTGIITGVLTGAVTGIVIGYFGVQFAFKRLRQERAFDRKLEWYEKTIRALGNFSRLTVEMEIAAKYRPLDAAWEKGAADLQQCLDEATLYADQESYWQLLKTVAKSQELKEKSDRKETTEKFWSIARVLRAALVKLSKRIREKLGFKEIEKQ
jgi:hypothetical protein